MNRDPRFALSQELEAKQTLLDQLRALAIQLRIAIFSVKISPLFSNKAGT
jgi:hypothetical protein